METASDPLMQPSAPRPVEEPTEASLEFLSRLPRGPEPRSADGAHIGVLSGLGPDGGPLVECASVAPGRVLAARSTVPVAATDIGREAVLLFERADPARPILMGLLQPASDAATPAPVAIVSDGERLTLSADREIVLSCGEASITLTRAGKVLIRGKYLLSRSAGVNRIKGGSVQIN